MTRHRDHAAAAVRADTAPLQRAKQPGIDRHAPWPGRKGDASSTRSAGTPMFFTYVYMGSSFGVPESLFQAADPGKPGGDYSRCNRYLSVSTLTPSQGDAGVCSASPHARRAIVVAGPSCGSVPSCAEPEAGLTRAKASQTAMASAKRIAR